MTYLQATLLSRMDRLLQLRRHYDLDSLGKQLVDRSIYATLIDCGQAGVGAEARGGITNFRLQELDRAAGLHRYHNGLNHPDKARYYEGRVSLFFGELVLADAGQEAFAVLDRNNYDPRQLLVTTR